MQLQKFALDLCLNLLLIVNVPLGHSELRKLKRNGDIWVRDPPEMF